MTNKNASKSTIKTRKLCIKTTEDGVGRGLSGGTGAVITLPMVDCFVIEKVVSVATR